MPSFLLFIVLLFPFLPVLLKAQDVPVGKNLLSNGNFESGNLGFFSDLQYSKYLVNPGFYTVTNKASKHNQYFQNPVGGDHTSGKGSYMIADFTTDQGNIVWKTKVEVSPNSRYKFTAFFCNLTSGGINSPVQNPFKGEVNNASAVRLVINGKDEGSVFYVANNNYAWLETFVEWDSKNIKGLIEIAIKSENYNESGNDLALDDISFILVEKYPVNTVVKPKKVIKDEVVTKKSPEKRYTLKAVVFEVGKADLLSESRNELDSLSTWLRSDTSVSVRLEGHTDNIGTAEGLLKLSELRVEKVKEYLVSSGVDSSRIKTVGFGGTKPIADNSNEETRKLNRRVEVVVY